MTTAVKVEKKIAMSTISTRQSRKLDSHIPFAANLSEAMNPVIAPTMNTSPWAKLMNPRTP